MYIFFSELGLEIIFMRENLMFIYLYISENMRIKKMTKHHKEDVEVL